MSASQTATPAQIGPLFAHDYADWEKLFRAYIDFYQTSIPDEQYPRTFQRLIKPDGDIRALVLRGGDEKLLGIAHFYTHQTPWSEGLIMHLNGRLREFSHVRLALLDKAGRTVLKSDDVSAFSSRY